MRLIDADALIKTLGIAENCSDCQYQNGPLCDKNDCFVDACEAIFEQPTIDAVEVVRCKDCKHFPIKRDRDGWVRWPVDDEGYEDETCVYFCEDGYYSMMPPIEGFCHKGERRDDER